MSLGVGMLEAVPVCAHSFLTARKLVNRVIIEFSVMLVLTESLVHGFAMPQARINSLITSGVGFDCVSAKASHNSSYGTLPTEANLRAMSSGDAVTQRNLPLLVCFPFRMIPPFA